MLVFMVAVLSVAVTVTAVERPGQVASTDRRRGKPHTSPARDYAERGVRVLQVNANDPRVSSKDTREVSRKRVAAGEFAGPYLVDDGRRVARAWGARHTPGRLRPDAAGVVVYHGAPDADVDDDSQNARWYASIRAQPR
jgi:hypothetical protein